MTAKQKLRFNLMLSVLQRIRKYQTPAFLRRHSEREYGTDYLETLEMAYENIQEDVKFCIKGIRKIRGK